MSSERPCARPRRTAPGTHSPLAARRKYAGRCNDRSSDAPVSSSRHAQCGRRVLEPEPRSALSFAFFAPSQAKYFTAIGVAQRVPERHTLASAQCARQCAQTRSKDGHSAANANQRPIKNGPEIINFRPVLESPASLSKPPPSASRPPHRARKLSINDRSSVTRHRRLSADCPRDCPCQPPKSALKRRRSPGGRPGIRMQRFSSLTGHAGK